MENKLLYKVLVNKEQFHIFITSVSTNLFSYSRIKYLKFSIEKFYYAKLTSFNDFCT